VRISTIGVLLIPLGLTLAAAAVVAAARVVVVVVVVAMVVSGDETEDGSPTGLSPQGYRRKGDKLDVRDGVCGLWPSLECGRETLIFMDSTVARLR
jgi:hypothetical protein